MQGLAILGVSIVGAIAYGIAMDNVTARICVEYFTIGHPRVIASESPTALAFTWGVLATWWVGAIGGALVALSARLGRKNKLSARQCLVPIAAVFALAAASAIVFGAIGRYAAQSGHVALFEPLASAVPLERHVDFLTDLWAHTAAYGAAFLGVLLACASTLVQRRRSA